MRVLAAANDHLAVACPGRQPDRHAELGALGVLLIGELLGPWPRDEGEQGRGLAMHLVRGQAGCVGGRLGGLARARACSAKSPASQDSAAGRTRGGWARAVRISRNILPVSLPMPGVGTHPDLPTTFVHFTGRPRGMGDIPPDFADATPEQRMMRILLEGRLRATKVFGTRHPVLCFSEPSEAARRVMLRDGVVRERGPYSPWGLVFDRARLIAAGARPVLYLSSDEIKQTDDLPIRLRNRRVRYDPGRSDWLHEREWRICYRHIDTPELELAKGLVVGVIVGERGWVPPPNVIEMASRTLITDKPGVNGHSRIVHMRYSAAADQLARWWWNGEDLIDDGVFDIGEQMQIDQLLDHPR